MKALQVRLEEQQERNNTLIQVNSTLREQLEQSESTNHKLRIDLDVLSKQWGNLNEEWNEKQKQELDGHPDTSHAKVSKIDWPGIS